MVADTCGGLVKTEAEAVDLGRKMVQVDIFHHVAISRLVVGIQLSFSVASALLIAFRLREMSCSDQKLLRINDASIGMKGTNRQYSQHIFLTSSCDTASFTVHDPPKSDKTATSQSQSKAQVDHLLLSTLLFFFIR